jgi:hypothetical protein
MEIGRGFAWSVFALILAGAGWINGKNGPSPAETPGTGTTEPRSRVLAPEVAKAGGPAKTANAGAPARSEVVAAAGPVRQVLAITRPGSPR